MSGLLITYGRSHTPRGGLRTNPLGKRELKTSARLLHSRCQEAYSLIRTTPPTEQILSTQAEKVAQALASKIGTCETNLLTYILLTSMQIHHTPTLHHQKRVAELCRRISDELGTNNGKTTLLVAAAVIHDTGKLLIPTNLLDQRQDLSPSEIRIIKEGHLLFGFHLLRLFGYSEEVTELVGHHHAMNGNNPEGLINRPISTEGQILIAADHFDALTNGRGYRDGNFSTKKVAIEEISRLPIEREIIDALESLAVPSASAGRTRTR